MINKEHGDSAREAVVEIEMQDALKGAEVIYLSAPKGDVTAKEGMTLGGASISAEEGWRGKWNRLSSDQLLVKVPAASAVIVKIPKK